ncbi:HWE histidine kinase domain-containing protein [Benzoatithermus flavus]|uniref:histidine kinase n=1 Tax=Benzoatithermus flavus TaxID=3108223 RepID=A0ABU8XNB2_9PROT
MTRPLSPSHAATLGRLERELAYYRRECNDLGARLLRLQEEQSSAFREARRSRTVAKLIREAHRLADTGVPSDELAGPVLEIIVDNTMCDRAALLSESPVGSGRFTVLRAIGLGEQPLAVSVVPDPPSFFFTTAQTPLESPAYELTGILQLPYVLWAYDRSTGYALIIGNRLEANVSRPFEPGDQELIEGGLSVYLDVLARRRAEEAQILLMDELNHRVKNILATIEAMVGCSAAEAGSPEELAEALAGRIAAMARTHDLLTDARWRSADLGDLVEEEMRPYAVADRVRIAGERQPLNPRAALSLSLILHELTTNAVKYGSLSVPEGRVDLSWSRQVHAGGPTLRLVWRESGGPSVTPPVRRGFGTTLIERAAARDLNGAARLSFETAGLRCELEYPLARISPPAAAMAPRIPARQRVRDSVREDVLAGTRVLVVEDELMLTMTLERILKGVGAEPVGPATTVPEALFLAGSERIDAAVLDVNVADEPVFPVADMLREQGVPFIFATGYATDSVIPARHKDVPRLPKPYRQDRLLQMLARALARESASGDG